MSKRLRLAIAGAIAVGVVSPAFAGAPKYETKRLPAGSRADRYVLVRVADRERRDRPYALTGKVDSGEKERRVQRYVPSHPKGTH